MANADEILARAPTTSARRRSNDPARPGVIGVAGLGTVGGGLIKFLQEKPGFAPAGDKARW